MDFSERAPRRLIWLGLNVLLSLVAASVLLLFEQTVAQVYALVFFIPIICNLSGCSGNQAVAVSIRELALGLIQPGDFMRVWGKELIVGAANGLVIGTLLATVALALNAILWQESMVLALVIGAAFALNTLVAVSLGGLIPLMLRAFGLDPALGAPPILTTLTDMCGLIFILALASATMAWGYL